MPNLYGSKFRRLLSQGILWGSLGTIGLNLSWVQAAPKCGGRITIPGTVNLVTATSQELVAGVPGLAIKRDDLSTIPPFNTTLRRSLPGLWRGEVAANGTASAVSVDYALVGTNGCQNCLSHGQYSNAQVLVTLEPLPVVIEPKPGNGKNCRDMSGGVNLVLDLKSANYAGSYQGQLQITVTQL